MILLDTTVLLYAVGSDHALRAPCRALVAAIGEGTVAATTTVEVLQEFAHVRARRRSREDAAARGMNEFRQHEALGAFDAVLAAAALRREHITALVSADRAFASVPLLRHLDPAASDFSAQVGLG